MSEESESPQVCVYCDSLSNKDNPVKSWDATGEPVCFNCRTDFLWDEYFPKKDINIKMKAGL